MRHVVHLFENLPHKMLAHITKLCIKCWLSAISFSSFLLPVAIDGQYSAMWSHLLPSAQRHHNLLIITQCSVLPDNLVRCVTGQLEVLPLSVLQSVWMFARLTQRICIHKPPPLNWRDVCGMLHGRTACHYCRAHTNVVREELKRSISDTPKSLHCKGEVILATHPSLDSDGPCCDDVKLIAKRCRSMNGLPFIISLQSTQTIREKYPAVPTLPYAINGFEKACALSAVQQSLHSAWLKNYLDLSLPAKQLLSLIAFLHPDQIFLRLFLCEDSQCWMPDELVSFVFGSIKEDTVLYSELACHSLHHLLAELQHHSLISFLPNQGGELKMFSSSNESSLFCLHRLTRQCMLVHLRKGSGQFVRFLQCAIGIVWTNVRTSVSIAYTETYVMPHAIQLSPSVLLPDCMEYCNFPTSKPEPRAGFSAFLAIDSSDAQVILMHLWCSLLDCVLQVGLTWWNIHEYSCLRADARWVAVIGRSYKVRSERNWNGIDAHYDIVLSGLKKTLSLLLCGNRQYILNSYAYLWSMRPLQHLLHTVARAATACEISEERRCAVDGGMPFSISSCTLEYIEYKANYRALLRHGIEFLGLIFSGGDKSDGADYLPESQKESVSRELHNCITGITAALDTGLERSRNTWLTQSHGVCPIPKPVSKGHETTSNGKQCAMSYLSQRAHVTDILASVFEGKSLLQPLALSRLITVSCLHVSNKHRTSLLISHLWIPLSIAVIFHCASGMLLEAKVAMERTHCAVQSGSVLELAAQCLELFLFIVVNKEPLYYFLTQEDVCADFN